LVGPTDGQGDRHAANVQVSGCTLFLDWRSVTLVLMWVNVTCSVKGNHPLSRSEDAIMLKAIVISIAVVGAVPAYAQPTSAWSTSNIPPQSAWSEPNNRQQPPKSAWTGKQTPNSQWANPNNRQQVPKSQWADPNNQQQPPTSAWSPR
jgi:hypothetical protein